MLPFFVSKNKCLKNVKIFGWFKNYSYICGVKEQPIVYRYF